MDGQHRQALQIGTKVRVVKKEDQRTGTLTDGVVKKILTNSSSYPNGIKVMLENGVVGRVKEIIH